VLVAVYDATEDTEGINTNFKHSVIVDEVDSRRTHVSR
jgi:hypothetical protein